MMVREACASHAADRHREETRANRLAVVRARVLAGVRCAIALNIETVFEANGDGADSTWTCDNAPSTQGFVVLRDDRRIGARSMAIDLDGAGLTCRYHGCHSSIGDAPERDRLTIEMGRDGATLSIWNGGLSRRFANADALSAFLLAPLLATA